MRDNVQASASVPSMTRRRMLAGCAAATGIAAGHARLALGQESRPAEPVKLKGRIRQSVAYWCYEKYWDLEKTCQVARQLGCAGIELVPPEQWPVLKGHGLICALAGSHGFQRGMNNPKYQPDCLDKLRAAIDACSEHGFPNAITFTGFREDIPDDVGLRNCVEGYKRIIGHAEKKKVNLCLEMLNSRVAVEMKGHPGYQGNHVEYVVDIIRQVGSPRMKLLFDVYHVQIMDGDLIARIRQFREYIGHVHTAGNPGRCELDDHQEINYRAVMEELARGGYAGYVGQEFIPTRDPLVGLREAVLLCDV